jgi:yeast amino acid transporter
VRTFHIPSQPLAYTFCHRIFFFLWIFYKLYHRTKVIAPADVDLITGKREIDLEEEAYLEKEAAKGPRTWQQKLWDAL